MTTAIVILIATGQVAAAGRLIQLALRVRLPAQPPVMSSEELRTALHMRDPGRREIDHEVYRLAFRALADDERQKTAA